MASQGSLIIYAYLANEIIPVEDAIVTVTKKEEEKNLLLGIRKTDSSGRTTPIAIETPDVEYSLEPQSEVKPFASVDVRVDHPSTYTSVTTNVQIFPGEVSLENVMLIPLSDDVGVENRQKTNNITPQDL